MPHEIMILLAVSIFSCDVSDYPVHYFLLGRWPPLFEKNIINHPLCIQQTFPCFWNAL